MQKKREKCTLSFILTLHERQYKMQHVPFILTIHKIQYDIQYEILYEKHYSR